MNTPLLRMSEHIGSSSPEKALKNFIEMLKKASPQLRLAMALLTPWAMLVAAITKHRWLCSGFDFLRRTVVQNLYASVSIPASHPLNKQLLEYMVEHGLGKDAKTLSLPPPQLLLTPGSSTYQALYGDAWSVSGRPGSKPKPKRHADPEDEDREVQALAYVPDVGKYTFWHKGYRMTFERVTTMQEQIDGKGRLRSTKMRGNETSVISCPSLFSGATPIRQFLDHVQQRQVKDHTTSIFRPEDGRSQAWDQGITRPSRTLNAVTLDASVKDAIVKDIETYLAPATRQYYANRGIPWRRGFLFYGPPGTGKTSFTTALAGHFKLNVYLISLSTNNLNDRMLERLFEQLPSRCIVLLEDIDSAGIVREDMRAKEKTKKEKKKTPRKQVVNAYGEYEDVFDGPLQLTLSGLLNVLDGATSREGLVTIMTSNSPDSLDPALVRPGRIDRKVLFGFASKEVIAKLFTHIFEKSSEELLGGEATSQHDITALAEAFAANLSADKLTPAEVQGYLLVHRDDPLGAVAEAAEWAEKTLETKAKGANVADFATAGEVHRPSTRSARAAPNVVPRLEFTSLISDPTSTSTSTNSDSGFEDLDDDSEGETDKGNQPRTVTLTELATRPPGLTPSSLPADIMKALQSSGLSLPLSGNVPTVRTVVRRRGSTATRGCGLY